MRAFLRILTFALIGPPVGMFVLFSGMAIFDLFVLGRHDDVRDILHSMVSPQDLEFAYFFGGVPALCDGTFASVLARRVRGTLLYFWVAAVGAAVSAIFVCWGMLGSPSSFDPARPWAFVVLVAITGAGAGLVSLGVFDGIAWLRAHRLQPA